MHAGPDHYWRPAFSLEVFDLNVDQICDLLEKPGHKQRYSKKNLKLI